MNTTHRRIAIGALALWIASLIISAGQFNRSTISGFELVAYLVQLPLVKPTPGFLLLIAPLALSFLTNAVFLWQAAKPIMGHESAARMRYLLILFCGVYNLVAAAVYSFSVNMNLLSGLKLFDHPALYVWLGSFLVLAGIHDLARLFGYRESEAHAVD